MLLQNWKYPQRLDYSVNVSFSLKVLSCRYNRKTCHLADNGQGYRTNLDGGGISGECAARAWYSSTIQMSPITLGHYLQDDRFYFYPVLQINYFAHQKIIWGLRNSISTQFMSEPSDNETPKHTWRGGTSCQEFSYFSHQELSNIMNMCPTFICTSWATSMNFIRYLQHPFFCCKSWSKSRHFPAQPHKTAVDFSWFTSLQATWWS